MLSCFELNPLANPPPIDVEMSDGRGSGVVLPQIGVWPRTSILRHGSYERQPSDRDLRR